MTAIFSIVLLLPLGADADPSKVEFFERRIRPLFVDHCNKCHGEKEEGGLRLNSRDALLHGGDSGAAIVPGDPERSLLTQAIGYSSDDLKMPPSGKLGAEQIEDLEAWVRMGAVWGRVKSEVRSRKDEEDDRTSRFSLQTSNHWAFQTPRRPAIPAVSNHAWARTPVDRFILAAMERDGLPAPPVADRRTLIRRATYDLTGLPPTPAEVRAFLADESPRAFGKVVDRLLASPHYGERWGRHWLDIARYADSSGKDENHACANAFRYRDYVVDSFNRDKPYDRFLREQLAGDLMPAAAETQRYELLTATGFLQVGPKALAEQDKEKLLIDIVDEQLDVVSRGMLALTLTCARCHEHKLEPISMRDYYALAGIFKSTTTMGHLNFVSTWRERPLASPAAIQRVDEHQKLLAEKQKEIDKLRQSDTPEDKEARQKLEQEQKALESRAPPPIPMAMAVEEGKITDLKIHVRGSHLNLGDAVARGVMRIGDVPAPPVAGDASGRLELAQWITHPAHPLTSRVMVNRIWNWHFGQGLCPTTDNFGLSGEPPTHPELLDWLAIEFVERGWSIKEMHRLLMLSSAYRMSGPHFPRRRLDAEEVRDSLLAVSDGLDRSMGGSVFNYPNREPHVTYYKGPVNYDFPRRTIYLPVVRNAMYDVLDIFDHGNALTTHSHRPQTTVAPQALYMMNSRLVLQAADRLATRLLAEDMTDEARIGWVYDRALSRGPSPDELSRAQSFIKTFEAIVAADGSHIERPRLRAWQAFCQATLASNEFVFVE